VDIYDIPIATITAKFIEHVELIRHIDPDAIGEFLVMAATLMEIKSRTLLPHAPPEQIEEEFGDPRLELVQQLLEYKKFKDAARGLGAAAELQALKFPRHPAVPPAPAEHVDLEQVQLWDLVDAFRRLLEQTGRRQLSHEVVYDDTPIALHATDVLDSLERAGGLQLFEAIFIGRNKSQMIGLFLALLELIRQKRVRACQEQPFGPISIQLLDPTPITVEDEPRDEPADSTPFEQVANSGSDSDQPEAEWDGSASDEDGDQLEDLLGDGESEIPATAGELHPQSEITGDTDGPH
jgi:segregation and condensation protein A